MVQFHECFTRELAGANLSPRDLRDGECRTRNGRTCSLCHSSALHYGDELRLKNSALKIFWEKNRIPLDIGPIVPSPLGRFYRTVTKRKVFVSRGHVQLGLIDVSRKAGGPASAIDVVQCVIEPEIHGRVYAHAVQFLDTIRGRTLAEAVNYVIVKGNYTELTVIFNVRSIEPRVLKRFNALSKALTSSIEEITGIFLYHDQRRSRYYLSSGSGEEHLFRRVYGKKEIFQKIDGKIFLYSPLSFSQVNSSIIGEMIGRVKAVLSPDPGTDLYDLYCGYGLFALSFSDRFSSVTGVEISAASVESAKSNARRQHISNARFIRKNIDVESIPSILEKARGRFSVILDPPRGGTSEGVIEAIAARKPGRVVHIFCDIDRLPKELKRWQKSGFKTTDAIPLDMFPGTDDLEVIIGLGPA